MIDKRFSSDNFAKLGRDTAEAEALAKELAASIAAAMHSAVAPAIRSIAAELRALGHDLNEDPVEHDTEFDTRGYAFRDVGLDRGMFDHRLRFSFDTQVCTGYPHEISEEEALAEYLDDE